MRLGTKNKLSLGLSLIQLNKHIYQPLTAIDSSQQIQYYLRIHTSQKITFKSQNCNYYQNKSSTKFNIDQNNYFSQYILYKMSYAYAIQKNKNDIYNIVQCKIKILQK
ncbi:hypothetical protein pb186bvf_009356 [Paramecium bursaria]